MGRWWPMKVYPYTLQVRGMECPFTLAEPRFGCVFEFRFVAVAICSLRQLELRL